ncbi:unnamed protein product [Notodromas monacha]|uniref:ODAD1 central coiled coil region domain-containing protein n=1 Tax=Notodromas monacha TaxID=399045 RepID=A0A7R9GIP5_9CRUS|nr:unnamed protein product [Notodromas monacha]CAG0924192.1 unnamed protein product [Notodromas monacha]
MEDLEAVRDLDPVEVQRRFRVMEEDRKAYIDSTSNSIRLQRSILSRLEDEKKTLELQLETCSSLEVNKKIHEQLTKLSMLLEQYDGYLEAIQKAELQIEKLLQNNGVVESEIRNVEASIGGESTNRKKRIDLRRRVAALEDRVEHATRQLNGQLSSNGKLRKEIEELMRDREAHCKMTKRLTEKFARGSKQLQNIVNQVSQIYDQRDEIESRLKTLKQLETEEAQSSAAEIQHLRRILTEQTRLEKFLMQKSAPRIAPSHLHRTPSPAVPFFAATAVTTMKHEARQQDSTITDDQKWAAGRRVSYSDLTSCGKMLYELVSLVTGSEEVSAAVGQDPMSDADHLVSWFVKREEENMALYSESHLYTDAIVEVKQEISELKNRGNLAQTDRKEERVAMEERVMKAKVETEEIWQEFECTETLFSDILWKIEALFAIADSFGLPLIELLGGQTKVSAANAMVYLSVIEKRVVELLEAKRMLTGASPSPHIEPSFVEEHNFSVGGKFKDDVGKGKCFAPEIREEEPLMGGMDAINDVSRRTSTVSMPLPTNREEVVNLICRSVSPAASDVVIPRSRSMM